MDTPVRRESAQIIPFPLRAQVRPGELGDAAHGRAESSVPVYKAAVGSGWYHEAAIQEALQARDSGQR